MKKLAALCLMTIMFGTSTAQARDLYRALGEHSCHNKKQKITLLQSIGKEPLEEQEIEKLLRESEGLCSPDAITVTIFITMFGSKGPEILQNRKEFLQKEFSEKGLSYFCTSTEQKQGPTKPLSKRPHAPN